MSETDRKSGRYKNNNRAKFFLFLTKVSSFQVDLLTIGNTYIGLTDFIDLGVDDLADVEVSHFEIYSCITCQQLTAPALTTMV